MSEPQDGVTIEELRPAKECRQWRILHNRLGTIVSYVGESITPDRALFCWRCGDVGCHHCRMVQELTQWDSTRDSALRAVPFAGTRYRAGGPGLTR